MGVKAERVPTLWELLIVTAFDNLFWMQGVLLFFNTQLRMSVLRP